MYALDDETRNRVKWGNVIIAILEQQCCGLLLILRTALLLATVDGNSCRQRCCLVYGGLYSNTLNVYSTAIDGSDYNSFFTTLTFSSGSSGGSSQCTNVQILDDNFVEDDESFFLSASLVSPIPVGVTIDRSTATVVIQDNDSKWKCTFKCTNI